MCTTLYLMSNSTVAETMCSLLHIVFVGTLDLWCNQLCVSINSVAVASNCTQLKHNTLWEAMSHRTVPS